MQQFSIFVNAPEKIIKLMRKRKERRKKKEKNWPPS